MRRRTTTLTMAVVLGLLVGCGSLLDQDPLSEGEQAAEAEETTESESVVDTEEVVEEPSVDDELVAEDPIDDEAFQDVQLDDAQYVDDPDDEVEPPELVDPESADFPVEALMSQYASEEAEFLQRLNSERTSRGMNSLRVFWDLENSARSHSELMASQNHLHHNPNLASVTESGYWSRIGENVGRGGSVASLHDAFMASPGHRDNILGDYSHVGIGVTTSGSTIWVTVVFMKAAVSGLHNTYPPFADSNFNTHDRNIQKIYEAGITHGCSGGERPRYCPDGHVTRGQMAAFLDRALGLPDTNQSYFTDTQGRFYERHANRLRAANITYGCSDTKYCGEDPVTRGQMAAFLDRALNLPDTNQNYFNDTQGTFYEQHANRLKAAGITHGCGNGNYCGEQPVTRAQMASFLARALNL